MTLLIYLMKYFDDLFKYGNCSYFMQRKFRSKKFETLNKHIDFQREPKKSSARKTDTAVICCKCKKKIILPFKPRKPEVYCDECFKNK